MTGHQATPFSEPPNCSIVHLTEYVERADSDATLRGTVVDATDRPAVGAMVFVSGRDFRHAITDEAGRYDVGALAPGDYRLEISYENNKGSLRLEIRCGTDSIDHPRAVDRDCPLSQLPGNGIAW